MTTLRDQFPLRISIHCDDEILCASACIKNIPIISVIFCNHVVQFHANTYALIVWKNDNPSRTFYLCICSMRLMQCRVKCNDLSIYIRPKALCGNRQISVQIMITPKLFPFFSAALANFEFEFTARRNAKGRIVSVQKAQSGCSHSTTSE